MTRSILFSVRLSTEWDRLRHSGQCTEPFWAAVLWMQDVQKLCWHLSDTGLVIRSKHIAHWSSSATDVSARERACIATRPLPSLTARMSDAATLPSLAARSVSSAKTHKGGSDGTPRRTQQLLLG